MNFTDPRDPLARSHVFGPATGVMVALQQAATVDEPFAQRQEPMLDPDLRHTANPLMPADMQ